MNFLITLKQELLETEPWILESGFKIVRHSYGAMGTSDIELQSETLRLRFERDIVAVFAQVAPMGEPERWAGVAFVLEAVQGVQPPRIGRELHDAASPFRENPALLEKALGPDWPRTKQELERRHQERFRAAMTARPLTPQIRWMLFRRRLRRPLKMLAVPCAIALIVWLASR